MNRLLFLLLVILSCSSEKQLSLDIGLVKNINIPKVIKPTPLLVCPSEMSHVFGNYCTNLIHYCDVWLDKPGSIIRRCAKYKQMNKCIGGIKELNFCIDKFEYSDSADTLPKTDISWAESISVCEKNNKRLCLEEEWTLACEGPDWLPYPYGYERNSNFCHIDKTELVENGVLIDQRQSVFANEKCVSYFGIFNMTGNVGEWTVCAKCSTPFRSYGKGGWWGPLRNKCRAITGGHDENYKQIQIGFRCCKDL